MSSADEPLLDPGTQRRRKIVSTVAQRGHITIADLADQLQVSPMTIRRDLARLHESKHVIATRGGASAAPNTTLPAFAQRATTRAEQKTLIAERACRLIVPRSVISIDSGSTTALLARAIPKDLELSVVTSSFAVVEALLGHESVEVLALGGQLRREALSFVGARATTGVADLQVHTHFLAAAAMSDRGVFDPTDGDATVKRSLLDVAQRVVLVADSSKFSQLAFSRICEWSRIHFVVTDDGIEQEWRDRLEAAGIEVIVAGPGA